MFRTNISDVKIERRFDDCMSSLSSSKYMIELIVYIVAVAVAVVVVIVEVVVADADAVAVAVA